MRAWLLPITSERMSANDRPHWALKARQTKALRSEAYLRAMGEHIPNLDGFCDVQLIWIPKGRRRRDEENLNPTLKAVVDGLVDAGVLTDDTPDLVRKKMTAIVTPPELVNFGGEPLQPGLYLLVKVRATAIEPLSGDLDG